jgi:hypothetical protein
MFSATFLSDAILDVVIISVTGMVDGDSALQKFTTAMTLRIGGRRVDSDWLPIALLRTPPWHPSMLHFAPHLDPGIMHTSAARWKCLPMRHNNMAP